MERKLRKLTFKDLKSREIQKANEELEIKEEFDNEDKIKKQQEKIKKIQKKNEGK